MHSAKSKSNEVREALCRAQKAARTAARRLRANRVLQRTAAWLPVPLIVLVVQQGLRLQWLPLQEELRWMRWLAVATSLAAVGAVFQAYFRGLPPQRAALALDRHHQLAERLSNALALAASPEDNRTAWVALAIADGVGSVKKWAPRRAVPLSWPRHLWFSVGLLAALVALGSLPEPKAQQATVEVPVHDSLLAADDLQWLQHSADRMVDSSQGTEVAAAAKRFQALVEQAAKRRLTQSALFRKLAELESQLGRGEDAEQGLLEGLKAIAKQLSKSKLTLPVANELEAGNLTKAAEALRRLAKRLRGESLSKPERKRLRQAMKAAAEQSKGRVARLQRGRRATTQARKRLLKKKAKSPSEQRAQQAKQRKHKRRLKRLGRQSKRASAAAQKLSQLDRELAAAAESLMKEMGRSAEHIQQGARDVQKMARQKMTRKQKQELKKQIEQMRKMLRQGGKRSPQHRRRLEKFARKARGKRSPNGKVPPSGRGGKGAQLREVALPGTVSSVSEASQTEAVSMDGKGRGAGHGSGEADQLTGAAAKLAKSSVDVQAVALDSGSGLASSEVVYGAAERGFASRQYRRVFTQYETVAEEVLGQQEVPSGYETSVRRYFQLIRPRGSE